MKNKKLLNSRVAYVISPMFGIVFLFTSCNKQVDSKPILENIAKVKIKVEGIDESRNSGSEEKKASAKNAESSIPSPEIVNHAGFDANTVVDNDLGVKTKKLLIKNSSSKGNSSSSGIKAADLNSGATYRLFLYKADGTYVSSETLSNTVTELELEQGVSYNWYALSYNTNEEVANVDPANPTIKTLNLPGGKDILYDSGSFEVPDEDNHVEVTIGVLFEHKVSRIGIELNTMGMFANISNAALSATGLTLQTGEFNIETGTWGSLTSYNPTISYSNFVDVNPLYQDAKIAYFYTAGETTLSSIVVSVNDLNLIIDDNSTRSFTSILAATPSTFNFSVTPQIGDSHRLLINLIESPLTVGGVKWARQNVYYVDGHNPYRFHHTYAHSNNINSFFSFKGNKPSDFGVNGDPCKLVYPEGTWKTPSAADFRSLVGTLPPATGSSVTYGTAGGLGYFLYTDATGLAAPYPGNDLRFNFNGGSLSVGIINGILDINLGNFGSNVQMWTSESAVGIPGIAGLGAYSYEGNRVAFPALNNDILSPSLLNVSVIGVDVIETPFKNIRCIR